MRRLITRVCINCGANENDCMCHNPQYDTRELDFRSLKEKDDELRQILSFENVRQCPNCGKAAHLCICDDEDWEDDGETNEDDLGWSEFEGDENYADDVDAFGRNYSDADPGL